MHADAAAQETQATVTSSSEMLTKVRRDLVQIHASIAERTTSDPDVTPWALHELMSVIREIRAFQREHSDR
jgi:hypothetical protein